MEKLRVKRDEMLKKLEELEEREMIAKRKTARLDEIISKDKNEADTRRRSCKMTEYQLDKTEDLLDQKLEKLVKEHKRIEKESSIIHVLQEREQEIDNAFERLEPRAKEAMQRRHDVEMRCMEAKRKLTLTTAELHKIRARKIDKEEQVRELDNMVKVGGRSIQQFQISEEKFGDKEDDMRHRIRMMNVKLSATLMRAEENERRCRRLEDEKEMLEEEVKAYRKNYDMMHSQLDEYMNDIDNV